MSPHSPLHCFWLLSLPLPVVSYHSSVEVWSTPVCQGCPPPKSQRWVAPAQTSPKLHLKLKSQISSSVCATEPQSGSSALAGDSLGLLSPWNSRAKGFSNQV